MVVVPYLTGMCKHRLDLLPDPLRPITDDAQPHGFLGNEARVFDLLQGLAQFLVRDHLMPAEHMHNTVTIEQVQPKPLGFSPFVVPSRPSGAMPCLPRAAPARTLRTRRDI